MTALKIATRNLVRNRQRAVAAFFIVIVGSTSLILTDGFIQWVLWAMRESAIQSELGHIQVMQRNYLKHGTANPFDYILSEKATQYTEIESLPDVKLVAPRLAVTGLISLINENDTGDSTGIAFLADGVDPEKEKKLSEPFNPIKIVKGHNLSSATANEVILGKGLARNINILEPGGKIALLVTTANGGINAVEAKVAGIFVSTNKIYDDSALRLPIDLAKKLLRTQGTHTWIVVLNDTQQTDHYLQKLRAQFPIDENNLDFIPWYQQASFYNKTVALFSQQINVLQLIIGSIIILSISNMLIMNVLERKGEIGTQLAIGFKRSKILGLFAMEGLLLGLIGATLGLIVGYALAELISYIGIPMPPPPGMEEGYTGEIRVTLSVLLKAFLIIFITTTIAGLYPAWKASRTEIINALRFNI